MEKFIVQSVKPAAAETTALLHLLISAMVSDRGAVSVTPLDTPEGITFKVRVAPKEIGKLIGAQGRLARALRVLLMSIGKENRQVYGLILDDVKRHEVIPAGVQPRHTMNQLNSGKTLYQFSRHRSETRGSTQEVRSRFAPCSA